MPGARRIPAQAIPTREQLLAVRPHDGAHRVALRAGISVLVPLVTVWALGHQEWSAYAAFGAFASLYGRNRVHLIRMQMQLSAGLLLTAAVVTGVVVGLSEHRHWLAVPVAAVIAATGSVIGDAHEWHPPGPLFLVFGFGACASAPSVPSQIGTAAAVAGLSALFSVLVGTAGRLMNPHPMQILELRFRWSWQPLRMAVAVLVSGSIATAIGIGHPYWAMVAAIAPLSVAHPTHQMVRVVHRVAGTFAGLLTAAALLALEPRGLWLILLVVLLQIGAELLIGRNYGIALMCVTPLALLMGQVVARHDPARLLIDRGLETVIGATVGVLMILAALHAEEHART